MLSKKMPEIIEAFEVLKVVSSNEETRRDAEIRIKAMSDKASSLAGAKKEGEYQKSLSVAKVSLENGLSMDMIAKITGLELSVIEKLQKELEVKNN